MHKNQPIELAKFIFKTMTENGVDDLDAHSDWMIKMAEAIIWDIEYEKDCPPEASDEFADSDEPIWEESFPSATE